MPERKVGLQRDDSPLDAAMVAARELDRDLVKLGVRPVEPTPPLLLAIAIHDYRSRPKEDRLGFINNAMEKIREKRNVPNVEDIENSLRKAFNLPLHFTS